MANACTVCSHPDREQIDREAMAPGANVAAISRRHGLSWSGREVHRHVANHVGKNLREAARTADQGHTAELLGRLVELADDAATIRQTASGRTAVAAVAAERGVLETIMTRLGVDNVKVVEELRVGRQLVQIVRAAIRAAPAVGEALAVEAARQGDDGAAEAFRELGAAAQQIERTS